MILNKEALQQFDNLCAQVGSTTISNLNEVILGLGTHFTPVNEFPKQKRVMRCGMKNSRKLKVRQYATCLIDIDEYLASL